MRDAILPHRSPGQVTGFYAFFHYFTPWRVAGERFMRHPGPDSVAGSDGHGGLRKEENAETHGQRRRVHGGKEPAGSAVSHTAAGAPSCGAGSPHPHAVCPSSF